MNDADSPPASSPDPAERRLAYLQRVQGACAVGSLVVAAVLLGGLVLAAGVLFVMIFPAVVGIDPYRFGFYRSCKDLATFLVSIPVVHAALWMGALTLHVCLRLTRSRQGWLPCLLFAVMALPCAPFGTVGGLATIFALARRESRSLFSPLR